MQTRDSRFVVTREDLNVDPVALVSDGLKIGRLPSCELVLNHPSVSRLHAGISETDGRFYLYNFSSSSGTALNGRVVPVESAEALVGGDVIQIGPYFLYVEREGETLHVRVRLEVALNVGESEGRVEMAQPQPQPEEPTRPGPGLQELSQALNVFWDKRKREAGKMQRVSPLRPQKPMRVLGKARFNWTPTRDLVRPWPFSVFVWGFAAVALLSVVAAVVYAGSYAPAPVSSPHTRDTLTARPSIAKRPNAGSCTTCHSLASGMDSNCSSCHQAEGFTATVTEPHARAGVGCSACLVEHQWTEYRPAVASLQTCTTCHDDSNKRTYNGRGVKTPHGGTFGYPVVNGRWAWEGLSRDEWEQKPEELRRSADKLSESLKRAPNAGGRDANDVRRSSEFHTIHLYRVKAPEGFEANKEREMSCGSCHKGFAPVDRVTPRTTCAACHNGDRGGKFETLLGADKPNCISCHVQHTKARREWGASLLTEQRN
jgi:pSer/pThr/pTyr-binding forkhead associated (FHA) protein